MSLVSFFLFVLVFIFVCLILLRRYYRNSFGYWKSLGVPYLTPVPVFGNSLKSALAVVSNSAAQSEIYEEASRFKYVGVYLMNRPNLFVKDLNLINSILVSEFAAFPSRGLIPSGDPMSANLVTLEGEEWHFLRSRLSPVFSSPNTKRMFGYVKECAENLVSHLDTYYASAGETFDAREAMARFTTDTISKCLFGLCENALLDRDSRLHATGRNIFTPTYKYKAKLLLRSLCPKLYRLLKFKARNPTDVSAFLDYLRRAIKENDGERNVLNVLLKLRNCQNDILNGKSDLTEMKHAQNIKCLRDKVLESNCFALFVAGYITTSSTLSYCLYSLADNRSVQEKLFKEMKNILARNGGQLNYEALKSYSFLDQIILETLRLYPPAISLERRCGRSFRVDESFAMEEGTGVTVPLYSLQRDPNYFQNPDQFLPERFAEENRSEIGRGTFLPFGDGPRSCIGRHLALLEMKMALGILALNFQFSLASRTPSPLEFSSKTFLLVPKDGIWLNVKKRDKT